jgi:hypothetical protein
MTCCVAAPPTDMFAEAIAHIRWKATLNVSLREICQNLNRYQNMKTFEEVFKSIEVVFGPINGIGKLATYDTTAAICKRFSIPINKVYIVGGGPKRAVQLLNIPVHMDENIKLKYANREDVLKVFGTQNMTNDDLESNLCNWQKSH